MVKPLAIPKLLGIDWWWLFVIAGAEGVLRYYFHVPERIPQITGFWLLWQAGWLRAAEPKSKAIFWYLLCMFGPFLINILSPKFIRANVWTDILSGVLSLTFIVAIFVFRSEMVKHFNETDPRGIELGGVMTFFFSSLYFQYWFHQIYLEQNESSLSIAPSKQTD